jgi:hypothetical protein
MKSAMYTLVTVLSLVALWPGEAQARCASYTDLNDLVASYSTKVVNGKLEQIELGYGGYNADLRFASGVVNGTARTCFFVSLINTNYETLDFDETTSGSEARVFANNMALALSLNYDVGLSCMYGTYRLGQGNYTIAKP